MTTITETTNRTTGEDNSVPAAHLQSTITYLEAERDRLRDDHERALRRLEDFKAEVGRLAMQKAREHGWCSVVQNTLEELGVPVPSSRFGFDVLLRVTVFATNASSSETTDYFIRDSLSASHDGEDGVTLGLDSDWESQDIASVSIEGIENLSARD